MDTTLIKKDILPISKLLQVLLDEMDMLSSGLCSLASSSFNLSCDEATLIQKYIRANRPSKYSSYSAFLSRKTNYFWVQGDKKNRIKWLKKHIKLNTPDKV